MHDKSLVIFLILCFIFNLLWAIGLLLRKATELLSRRTSSLHRLVPSQDSSRSETVLMTPLAQTGTLPSATAVPQSTNDFFDPANSTFNSVWAAAGDTDTNEPEHVSSSTPL